MSVFFKSEEDKWERMIGDLKAWANTRLVKFAGVYLGGKLLSRARVDDMSYTMHVGKAIFGEIAIMAFGKTKDKDIAVFSILKDSFKSYDMDGHNFRIRMSGQIYYHFEY